MVLDLLLTVHTADVERDILHRAGSIERYGGDDVLELLRLQLAQHRRHEMEVVVLHPDDAVVVDAHDVVLPLNQGGQDQVGYTVSVALSCRFNGRNDKREERGR